MTEIEAKVRYVKLARSLKTYGVSFFLVKVRASLSSVLRRLVLPVLTAPASVPCPLTRHSRALPPAVCPIVSRSALCFPPSPFQPSLAGSTALS